MDKTLGDYRIFVGAFPTGELAERIQAVRLQHDAKTARITAPHVTMAGTYWRSGPATPENESDTIARLQAIQCKLLPFELALGGVESFLPLNNVIYLRVERTASLLAARKVLLDTLGPDKERRYTPHLTLTMRLDRGETQALLKELGQSEWNTGRWLAPLDHLWLMQRGPQDSAWRYIYRIGMNGPLYLSSAQSL
jgi:2'-5' RNA ligase